ncbi:MAG: lytic transglycosylase domain-containing protein [Candidatus Eremiobacteraeota bacterium]|nr:lytic transglycosylase domain-containing protein [Candidatus Eremiobacteraeota bacterium]
MILVKKGRFSHLVLNEITTAIRQEIVDDPVDSIPGLIPLKASSKVISARIYNWIRYYNRGVSSKNARFIANRIVYYSKKYKQDPFLITALMSVESAFNMRAISPVGAIGLGQLMPGTASMLGVNPHNPDQNIDGSVRYLMYQMKRWQKSGTPVVFALASYNAGPGAVAKYGGIPPYRETIEYVNIVCALYYKVRKKK